MRSILTLKKLTDYINISKVLDDCMNRCKCTGGDSRGGIRWWGDISFSLKNISSLFLFCYGRDFIASLPNDKQSVIM